MSNFSDFFSAASGGGLGQTVTVGDISYPNARPIADIKSYKFYNSQNTSAMDMGYSSYYTNQGAEYYGATNSTSGYQTVADITSSTNGGGLYHCAIGFASWSQNQTDRQEKIRITIDGGTPVVFTARQATVYGYSFYFLGFPSLMFMQRTTNSSVAESNVRWPMYNIDNDSNVSGDRWYLDSGSGSYYNNRMIDGHSSVVQIPTDYLVQEGAPYLYFSSTLKVEMDSGRSTSDSYTAGIKLF